MSGGKSTKQWTNARILSYGVGNVLNDMCASSWFSYLLVFLNDVAKLSPVHAAVVMFSGQIADGVATPLVGVLSDRSSGFPSIGFGRRKTWNAGGCVVVMLCFFFVFGSCLPRWFTENPSSTVLVLYYCTAASVFNVGWAAVQVSHMAMVPELSSNDNIRIILNSVRYAFTILSNVMVFIAFYFLLHDVSPFNVPDQLKFTLLTIFTLVVGGICTLYFLIGTEEKCGPLSPEENKALTLRQRRNSPAVLDSAHRGPADMPFEADIMPSTPIFKETAPMTWSCWFKVCMFYEVGLIYMCTRLSINVTQVYIPFFLTISLHMSASSMAIVPLLVYLSGFVATFGMRYMNDRMGREGTFAFGTILMVLSLIATWYLTIETSYLIYPLSTLLGFGQSVVMVTSVCLEGDLVGDQNESGAFVYGAMSFTDKISNGVAVLLIQNARQAIVADPIADSLFVREIYCLVPGIAVVISAITIYWMRYGSGTLNLKPRRQSVHEGSHLLHENENYGTHA
ncbi:Glycoside-Pentoside-Hexuronide (GPH):Cation Symporter Family [Thraustotheca clavata]|uniref:Glycoside-Pentoside-Hexuronide (GPH):Cation Symporter Family n=1 Tax=Thraustotheca clavata TaxID=74557 RepID=A0A1V9Y834_9STRA|nr:Glycoside-Pentoside-Hexuronide (GPH):Cation Symporter Family [Thraustotheca clavata]